jgi:hypothetical protein
MGNFLNNGPKYLKLIVRVRIYHILISGLSFEPVATEIRHLHFTRPPATFYLSRIKNA